MADNVVAGVVEPPAPGDVEPLPTPGTAEYAEVERRGADALRRGEVGLVVLAGGMATRMGGVVKALVEAVDGLTFLDIRLREMDAVERRYGRRPPLLMMTSGATDGPIREALGDRLDDPALGLFVQAWRCARPREATCSATTPGTRPSTRRVTATWWTRSATPASWRGSSSAAANPWIAEHRQPGASIDAAVPGCTSHTKPG